MKIANVILITIGLTLALLGCNQNLLTNEENSLIGNIFDNDTILNLSFSSSLPDITSKNSEVYPLSGICDPASGSVTIVVDSSNITKKFPCNLKGFFSGVIDLRKVVSTTPKILATQGELKTSDSVLNDQTGPASAPIAIAPGRYVGGDYYNLSILCNEPGEVVSISGEGIDPDTQVYTCTNSGAEDFPLMLANLIQTSNPNNLITSSTDEYKNPSSATTIVNVPIDNVAPIVAIQEGANIIQGQAANFTITITDQNISTLNYTVNTSGAEQRSYSCTLNPCFITTGIISSVGQLTLTVAANAVTDDVNNTGDSVLKSKSLTVIAAGDLSFNNPLDTINTLNASSYPVTGVCDDDLGDVIVTVGPTISESISCDSPGVFNGNINLSGVALNPAPIHVTQGVKTADTNSVNDQTPLSSAPTVADQTYKNGEDITLALNCNEAGEMVTFTSVSLMPNPQMHTCLTPGSENVTFYFVAGQETLNPNNVIVSSVDVNGNPTTNSTEFNLPIDNVAPTVAIQEGANIIQGQAANFTITITDQNISTLNYTVNTSGAEQRSYSCTLNPCFITTGIISSVGQLTLTVAANAVTDDVNNTGDSVLKSKSLTVIAAGDLSFNNPLDTINTLNASSYPVTGVCDGALGDVIVTVGPTISEDIPCNSGTFSIDLNLSSVTLNPAPIHITQGVNTANANPVNDQTPLSSAPTVADQTYKNGEDITLALNCNEAGEMVTFTSISLMPNPQMHTCQSQGPENVTFYFVAGQETLNPNNVIVSSVDVNGNPTTNSTEFNLPIDNVAPTVAIQEGANIIQGQAANFTITITDQNISTLNYTVNTSGAEQRSYSCTLNPCFITTGIISSVGQLTLTVAANAVTDDVNNTGDSVLKSKSLTVIAAGDLSFNNPLDTINTLNASSYPVTGVCDGALGDVTVTVGLTISEDIPCNSGTFSIDLNLSSVTLNPASIHVIQGVKTANANPVNDQTPLSSAPTVADQTYKNGEDITLALNCNEAGEMVTFTSVSLMPNPQMHTCLTPGSENVTFYFVAGQETLNPNNVIVSSVDVNGNPTTNSTEFNLPIDNVAPTVTVAAEGNIVEGNSANFTITVSDGTDFIAFTPTPSSGTISSGVCSQTPCQVTVDGATVGTLILTVNAGDVVDAAGNTNAAPTSDNLAVSIPQILGVIVSSTDGDSDTWYEDLDTVSIQVQYDADVVLDTSSGTPIIQVTLSSGTKTAIYSQGSGSRNLDFTIPVVNNDYQCSGILALGGMNLNGGIIKSSLGGTVNNSGLPSSVSGAKIDAKSPTAPSALSNDPTNAFNNFSSELSWVQGTDECELSVEYGFGTSPGALDAQNYINIGSVEAYQAQSGNNSALFNLLANTNYYTSIRSVDDAGNMSQEENSLAWSFACLEPWGGISRLVSLDSSNEESIFDINNIDASDTSFDGLVNRWEDQSGNNNHLEAPSLSARPSYNYDGLSSGLDSYVQGDGEDDTLVKDIDDISTDFTFYYVLNALSTGPREFESYFSNTDNKESTGSFQLDIGGSTRGCSNKFRVLLRHTFGVLPVSICGADYTTGKHVFVVDYNSANTSMSFSIDGVEYGSYNSLISAPIFRWLRLFQNREGMQFQEAQVLELNLVTQGLNSSQRDAISEYLVCKWNVQL